MASEATPREASPGWQRWLVAGALLLIVAAGFALRVHDLSANDLTEDEELATGLPLLGYGDLLTGIAGRPPLSFFTQKIAVDIAGDTSAFSLRIPRVLEGCAAIVVLFLLMHSVAGVRCGIIAASLLALAHFHILWSRDARYYPMLALMALLCLYGLWSGGVRQRPLGFAVFAIGFAGAALTHYAGYLFCAAVALVMPLLTLGTPWRGRLLARPRLAGAALMGGGALALATALFLRDYLERVTRHLKWPDFTEPLPPLFDVSPVFLLNRFDEMMGVGDSACWVAMALCVIGLAYGARRHPMWAAITVSVLVVPYLLFFLFPPSHPWNSKYFIFMMPLLVANAALGIEALAALAERRLPRVLGRVAVGTILTLGLVALLQPNLRATQAMFAFPDRAQQDLGVDLTAWSQPGDALYYTWAERPRVLRHHFPPADDPERERMLRMEAHFPSPFAKTGSVWFTLDGKSDTPGAIAAELLSARYARVPYDAAFLAHAPNPQYVVFGQTCLGSPDAAGPLVLAPGENHTLSLLLPRAMNAALVLECVPPGLEGKLDIHVGAVPVFVTSLKAGETTRFVGHHALARGLQAIRISNIGEGEMQLASLAWLPVLNKETLHLSACDFVSLTGDDTLASVWPDETPEGMLLRDMRHGQSASYRFASTEERQVVVRVHALNDPPYANRYQLLIPNTRLSYEILSFDREDGTISAQDSKPFSLPAGMHTLSVGYIGVSADEFNRATRNGRVATEESLQNPGLLAVEVVPVP